MIRNLRANRLIIFAFVWLTVLSMRAQEFRAAWADVFHVGMGSAAEVDNMVATLVSGNYNVVIVQVVAYMDNNTSSHGAHWKSNILPWSSRVTAGFDPLAYLCTQAHANGIEVHAWLGGSAGAMYRVSTSWPPLNNPVLAAHPEWFMTPLTNSESNTMVGFVDGTSTYYIMDLGSPDAQEYVISIVKELVTNYPIDGINWDDEINGAEYTLGFGYPVSTQANYPRSGLARYRINTGYVGTPSNGDTAWANYRRRYKNEFMARVQAEIQSIKTNPRQPLRHTSAALAYSPVPGSCDFTVSTPYLYFCDWATMLQKGWVDAVVPQTYSASTVSNWIDRITSCWQYNRQVFPGLGAYLNTDPAIAGMITYSRSKGLKGNATYSYAVPTSGSGSGSGWWAYAAANVFTNVVSTPPMPWRNPATATEGIVWGKVTDQATGLPVDDATVSVTGGPTVKTDGNGYYVATLVPAAAGGTAHLTSATKNGSPPLSTNAIAYAGDIARYDFSINLNIPSIPTGLVATAMGTSQINLTWTDTATNETGFVVARGTVSGGPYNTVANLGINANAYTNTGLSSGTTYYYVVRATNSNGSSANSAQASATTSNPPTPPSITLQPQSQSAVIGQTVAFTVTASGSAPLNYRWRFGSSNMIGATTSQLILPNVQTNQIGGYSVVITNAYGPVTSSVANLAVSPSFVPNGLQVLWSLAPGSRSYLTTASLPNERGMAYNPVTRRLILVSRTTPSVYVLNADTGADLWNMNVSGVSGGTYPLLLPGAADDGAMYAGNLTTAGPTTAFKLYRWANDSSTTVPTTAYSGDPGAGNSQRWGDTLDVRGSGAGTQIIIASRGGNVVAIFTTADGLNFTPTLITVGDAPAGAFGLGVAFGAGNTFWGKATSQNLRQVSFSLGTGMGTTIRNHGSPGMPSTVAPIGVSAILNLLGGINVGATGNNFQLYNLATQAPTFIASTNFPTDNDNTGTGTGAVDFGEDRVYALGANNGIVAMQILSTFSPNINPGPINRAVKVGTNTTFTVGASGTQPLSYQWKFNNANITGATGASYYIPAVAWTNAGQYSVTVTNTAGSATSASALLTVLPASPSHIDSILLMPDGTVQLTGSGDVGNYTIESSTNLANWQQLTIVPNTNGSFFWFDSITNAPQRFYRARHD